jgi:hypothetical protein
MFDLANLSVFFFAYVFAVFAFLKIVFVNFGPSSQTPGDDIRNSISTLFLWLTTALIPLIASTINNVYTFVRTNWFWFALSGGLLLTSFALYENQPVVDKVNDAYEFTIVLPILNDVFLPVLNFLRVAFDTVICWTNALGSVGKIIRNQFLDITFDCDVAWVAIPQLLGKLAISAVNATNNFIIVDKLDKDYRLAPVIEYTADVISELNPLFDCQCRDFNFIWPTLINPDYGIIQSKHMALYPEVILNFGIDTGRQVIKMGVDVGERILIGCDTGSETPTEIRDCEVGRAPKLQHWSDLSCQFFTHQTDFVDDVFFSIDSMLRDKFSINIPWTRPPRVLSIFAMFPCLLSDTFSIGVDILTHLDLFFTLDSDSGRGNYAAELDLDVFMSRLYNVSTLIENAGMDISGNFAENSFCLLGRSLRILFGVLDFALQIFRRLCARNFSREAVSSLMGQPEIATVITNLENDIAQIEFCAQNLDDELGEVGTFFAVGISRLMAPLVRFVRSVIENPDDIISYLGATQFKTDIEESFEGLYIIAGATGSAIRQYGAFGSVSCSTRDVVVSPESLSRIEIYSMHLNLMCSLGTFVEMSIRVPLSYLRQLFDAIAAVAELVELLVLGGATDVDEIRNLFDTNQVFDIGKDNGIIENQCLWIDSAAMFIPSLFNIPDNAIQCPSPSSSRTVAESVYDVLRTVGRYILLSPFTVVRGILHMLSSFLCSSADCIDFGSWCDSFIKPIWMAGIVPPMQVLVSVIDFTLCITPADTGLDVVAVALGKAFIHTNYGNDVVVDCTDILNSVNGGFVLGFICGFMETISQIVDIVLLIFEKGFWQAIWELISGPLFAILDGFARFFDCVWTQITSIFETLGECGEALISVDRFFDIGPTAYFAEIEDSCDFDGVVDTCEFSFEIPEFGIGDPIPTPGYGTGGSGGSIIPPVQIYGSCIASNGICYPRWNTQSEWDGNTCAQAGLTLGANRLIAGQTCDEVNVGASMLGIGACCVIGGTCNDVSFAACDSAALLGGVRAVWSQNETCSSLNAQCRVISDDYIIRGCCITDGDKDIFNPNKRHAIAGLTANQCYYKTVSSRPFFVPGDITCSSIQADPIYPSLLNGSNTFLADPLISPLVNSTTLERTCCTPESAIYQSPASKVVNTACIVQSYTNTPVLASLYGIPPDPAVRIAGTGFDPSSSLYGSFWRCRSETVPMTANSFTGPTLVCVGCCQFGICASLAILKQEVLDWNENPGNLLYYYNTIASFWRGQVIIQGNVVIAGTQSTVFASPQSMVPYSAADRTIFFDRDFSTECRWVYARVTGGANLEIIFGPYTPELSIGTLKGKGDCTGIPDLGGGKCVVSDCRFLKRSSIVPRFDQCVPTSPYLGDLDALSEPKLSMAVLYFVNSTFNLSRDNTDAKCNTFVAPVYPASPPPPPVTTGGTTGIPMAPDEWVSPIFAGGSGGIASLSVNTNRRLLQTPEPEGLRNASHPCYEIYDIMQTDNSSRASNYLMRFHLEWCLLSNAVSYGVESLLFWNSRVEGKRLLNPQFLYRPAVGYSTLYNVTRGVAMAFSYVGYTMTEYVYANKTNVPANMTSGVSTWTEYAHNNRVFDDLSLRIGGFITMFSKLVVAYDHQGVPIPLGLGIFSNFLSAAKYVAARNQSVDEMYPMRHSGNNITESPPLFSEYGWSAINNFVTLNWMSGNGSSNYTEATLRIQKIKSLSTYTSAVAQTGLIKRGLSTEQAINFDELCDPRDRSCIDCELVVGSVETFVEVLLNCVEDMQDGRRFQLDIDRVILARTNTFIQANDTLKCKNPPLMEGDTNFLLDFLLDVTDMIVGMTSYNFTDFVETRTSIDPKWIDIGFARYWTKRIQCYATNFDEEDPHSIVMHLKKLRSCDPVTDNSAGRGRAGLPLRTAFLWVTGGAIVLFLAASLCLPSVAFNWVTLIVYIHLILWATYWWSPSCAVPLPPVPIPTYPDGLMDDLYVELREIIPRNCTEYHPDVASGPCSIEGRTFVDCSDYGFDFGGARHLAYALAYLDPATPSAIRDTSVPFLSSLMETPYFSEAFTGIEDIHQTPIGDYCFGFPSLSPRKFVPLLGAVLMAALLAGLALSFLSLILGGLITLFLSLSVVKSLISAFGNFVTRSKVRSNRYRVSSA